MSWMRFDPDMFEHPKFEQYANRPQLWSNATALFTRACAYATKQRDLHPQRVELHGLVPRSVLSRLVPFKGAESVAESLCDVPYGFEFGLFERDGTNYRIHDFHQYAPPEHRGIEPEAPRGPLSGAERARRHREAKRNGAVTDRNEARDDERDESNETSRVLPRSPSPSDLGLGLETRETRVTGCDGVRDAERDASGRDGVTVTPLVSENGARAERLRAGYVARFEVRHPGVHPDAKAQAGAGGPWLELARAMGDADVDRFLDAFFADAWCAGDAGLKLGALVSERVRLLTKGPTLAKTETRRRGSEPTSNEDFKRRVEATEGKGATCAIRDL